MRKNGQHIRATCLATLLQNKLNSDLARFTTHVKPVLQQNSLLTGFNTGGKTRNTRLLTCSSVMLQDQLHVFFLPVFTHLKE